MDDAIVVGGGAAGLAAATWLGRYRRRTVVIDAGEPRNRWTEKAHGYLGFDPCDPADLLDRGREHLKAYSSVRLIRGRVTSVEQDGDTFVARTDDEEHRARRVVLATGVRDEFPQIEGFFDHYGRSVFHCPACDGYEARGLEIVVLGWSEVVADFALSLRNWARAVTIVTDGNTFEGDAVCRTSLVEARIPVVEQTAVSFEGEPGGLRGVRLDDGMTVPCEMVFFTIGHHPIESFARGLGCALDQDGYVLVDHEGRTSVDGVYACGDLVPGLQLLQVAAAKGVVAGIGCAKSLLGIDAAAGELPEDPFPLGARAADR